MKKLEEAQLILLQFFATGTTDKAAVNTGTAQSTYDREFAEQLIGFKQFIKFGLKRQYGSKGTDGTIRFKYYDLFPLPVAGITEGVTPTPVKHIAHYVTATPVQYGDHVVLTDLAIDDSGNDEVKEAIEDLSEQASHLFNTITRDVLETSTNEFFMGSVVNRAAVITAWTYDDCLRVIAIMENNKVMPITKYVEGSDTFDTTPLEPAYIVFTHSFCGIDLRKIPEFLTVANYPSGKVPMIGEVGAVGPLRFLNDHDITVVPDAGGLAATNGLRSTTGTNADIFINICIGRNAYGRIMLNAGNVKVIVKAKGSGGTNDPLDQIATAGWIGRYTAKFIYNEKILLIETGATA